MPIIRGLKALDGAYAHTIIDCPPGTSCPVVESVHGCDYCLMVTEPTPFGLHDLRLMVRVLEDLKVPAGIIDQSISGAISTVGSILSGVWYTRAHAHPLRSPHR